ncbi:vWA domain-containing protein [Lignipirellula cremea]|uniref:VWFA domain-containing protein n=1 Tax=Lignipirellula cremea TaxID=2528010 RepID=A0A518DVW7_9BACT|nr:vWA domain-containing protein [Lignipirellula cremea]QDU95982.1 hypothetical protein Pla8534_38010 [Lignipirellula cremea]
MQDLDIPLSNEVYTPAVESDKWRDAPCRRRRLNRMLHITGWIGLLTLASALIWAVTWFQPPRPGCLVLLGAGYQDNLDVPQNVFGWQSVLDFAQLTEGPNGLTYWGRDLLRQAHPPQRLMAGQPWDQGMQDFEEPTLVMMINAHGASDTNGAYLIPQNADDSADPQNRLRLTDLLDRLAELPAEKHKLLLLDCTGVAANWRWGFLHNDFARELRLANDRISSIPNLVVICASDIDQRSWTYDDQRRTIFSHFLIEGLRGAAFDDSNDGRVNAYELFDFTASAVAGWVKSNRQASQTPLLLPEGDVGQERASAIDLGVISRSYKPVEPPTRAVVGRQPLDEAWQRCEQLSSAQNSPCDYAPQLWRIMLDTLVRYEQLIYLGDQQSADALRVRLEDLAFQIEQKCTISLASMQNTLAMPAVAGCDRDVYRRQAEATVNQLWTAPPAQTSDLWTKQTQTIISQAATNPDLALRLFRLSVFDVLIDRAAEDPQRNLAPAARLAPLAGDPLHPLPAEIHFVVMLNRDLDITGFSAEDLDRVRLAIEVRRVAERAAAAAGRGYALSEEVSPWIRDLVDAADKDRRAGEDMLLAGPQARADAETKLKAAQTQYERALTQSDTVRAALQVRNQALSEAPYYSEWLASRGDQDSLTESENSPVNDLLELWTSTHALTEQLEQPNSHWIDEAPPASFVDPQPQSLAARADLVRRQLTAMHSSYARNARSVVSGRSDDIWQEAGSALMVPLGTMPERTQLWEARRSANGAMPATMAAQCAVNRMATPPPISETTKRNAARQGRLALAMLGPKNFDLVKGKDWENFQQVQRRVEVFDVEQQWWESLARAGEQIRGRYLELPAWVASTKENADHETREKMIAETTNASAVCRLISDAATVTVNAPRTLRKLLLQDLLLWQADRTWRDHWSAQDPNAEPYYRTAGLTFLDDARQLDSHHQELNALQQKLQQNGVLAFATPSRLDLTSQQQLEVACQLEPGPGAALPPGYPTVWVEAGDSLNLVSPAPQERIAQPLGQQDEKSQFVCTLRSPVLDKAESTFDQGPTATPSNLMLTALFRGQKLQRQIPVSIHLQPELLVSRQPRPAKGSIAVQGSASLANQDGVAQGAITIVLDASGSMGPPANESFSAQTKYAEACQAIQQMMGSLPRGVVVSVWVFGQAWGPQKTTLTPEETIHRVVPPTVWSPEDPAQLQTLLRAIQYPAIEPWNESPLIEAMLKAKEDLMTAPGFKSMVVITDGVDNRFETQSGGQTVSQALNQAFRNSGIEVNLLGFKVANQEMEQAKKQFQVVETWMPPGKYYLLSQASELESQLTAAAAPHLRYWVQNYDNRTLPGLPADGLDVSQPNSNLRWLPGGADPGGYQLRFSEQSAKQTPVLIRGGDLLLLQANRTAKGLNAARIPYAKTFWSWKPSRTEGNFQAAVLQNQRTGDRTLEMLMTLEAAGQSQDVLQQWEPRDIWVEAAPAKAGKPIAVQWRREFGYAAPAWTLSAASWPTGDKKGDLARPDLKVWWSPDEQTPAAVLLQRGRDFDNYASLHNLAVSALEQRAVLESIAVEEHYVQTGPNLREKRSCLVVRMAQDNGDALRVRLEGVAAAGEEHRYYPTVGRYAALFWPVTADEADMTLQGVSLLSMQAFKRQAERRGYFLDFQDLVAPDPNDTRPAPDYSTHP